MRTTATNMGDTEIQHLHSHKINALYYIHHHGEHTANQLHPCGPSHGDAVYQCNKTDIRNPGELQKRVDIVMSIVSRQYRAESPSSRYPAADK